MEERERERENYRRREGGIGREKRERVREMPLHQE